ncbi:MAG: acyl-CoA dehydrogenase family protein, partial [Gammaproteobacteria bacterium]|nr:acyl-CoA dehydrogenase family protein [Gammaproteobacteria bacterium]
MKRAPRGGQRGRADFDELFDLAGSIKIDGKPALKNQAVREKLADWYCQKNGLKFTNYRVISALSRGATRARKTPSPK